jgi:riboflavin kinase
MRGSADLDGAMSPVELALDGLPSFSGLIVDGHKRGRLLGFPTANIAVEQGEKVPADGIFACWVRIDGDPHRRGATVSIGNNPTFDDVAERRIEAYVHDLAQDVYRRSVTVWVVRRLRSMERFGSLDRLVQQTAADVDESRRLLGGICREATFAVAPPVSTAGCF